ncbi:MAG: 1-(5-phosphoribosyl)-5-[(5-phosphoribosylamino)methylideneamino]imidazole-4-carboxamide isomerase [Thermodesulfobacteriota bacterium]
MIVIPAVDIKGGKCVRLSQGRADRETVYGDDPSAMAERFQALGAQRIHVVDLDGAFEKGVKNASAISRILSKVSVPIQVGGGIRDRGALDRWLDLGVDRVIVGTEAVRNPAWVKKAMEDHPGRVILGIDAKNGLVAVEGWTETTKLSAIELARSYEGLPVAAINFTDIARDGMQTGPNIEQTRRLAESTRIPVVASGGVSTIADVHNLMKIEDAGVVGFITGRAIYAGTLDLAEAIAVTSGRSV